MVRNPTLSDVAQLAGVSYATADRVLNRRGNVAAKSVEKVERAVEELGYVRNVSAAKLSRKSQQRLAFVLPDKSHKFFARMNAQLVKAMPALRVAQMTCDVIEFAAFEAGALRAALAGLVGQGYSGIAFVGQGADGALDVLATLRGEGVKLVALVSDSPTGSRDNYIGIDNLKAGSAAARLVGMAHRNVDGKAIVLAGSLDLRDHVDRVAGFQDVLKADFPNIQVAHVIETQDRSSIAREKLREALTDTADVTAIYNAGGGQEGVVDVLCDLTDAEEVFCIGHELIGPIRQALEGGIVDIVIDQLPELEVNRAVALLQALVDDLPPPPFPELIPAIYMRDNLPTEDF